MLATTSSSDGLILALQRAYITASPNRAVSHALLPVVYKTILRESSFLDSSACSFIYFCTASSVILQIVST